MVDTKVVWQLKKEKSYDSTHLLELRDSHSGCLLQYLSEKLSTERMCSGIWRMILKSIYENNCVCTGSSWFRRKSIFWPS